MIIIKMFKLILNSILFYFLILAHTFAYNDFDIWKEKFNARAINSGISKKVVNEIMQNAKFLPKVIEYDRYQPEFYEDTKTYISKRTSPKKVSLGKNFYQMNSFSVFFI